ncbi:MAG: sulfatase-like hydrolase/transferase [Planctomycetota bacterium]
MLLAALVTTVVDCLLMQRKWNIFSGGYLNPDYLRGTDVPLFVLGSLWLDAAVATLFVAPALWLTARLNGRTQARRLFVAALLCLLPIAAAKISDLNLHRYLGDGIQYAGLLQGLEAGWVGFFALLGLTLALALPLLWISGRIPNRWVALLDRGSRTPRRGVVAGAALVLGALVLLAAVGALQPTLQRQLIRKSTGRSLADLGDRATDFDGDGRGLVHLPRDHAPFDARRHPLAVDWPGNGVDENGIHGDLDARGDFAHEHFPPVAFVRKPDVVLFVLESFRADNLTAEVDGRPVAPVLRRRLAEGALHGPAYSHNGYTIEGLTHLFTGGLSLSVQDGLIDDFKSNGYLTACVSGEDESFGGIAQATGMVRAEYFVDARDDRAERYSASASSESLAVPWTVVVRNVETLLRQKGADDRPFFLYVNLQDCHFPYHHRALRPLLLENPVARSEIVAKNAEQVRRTYRNAAANVDGAVGRILETWQTLRGRPPALVVVGDHGESLFHDGVLGHGVRITGDQTQIPFIVSGLPVECVFPLGLADVRGVLRHALTRSSEVPTAATDPDRWVWQWVGAFTAPRLLGAAHAKGGVVYDLRRKAYHTWGEPPPHLTPPFPAVIRYWEQLVVRQAEVHQQAKDAP